MTELTVSGDGLDTPLTVSYSQVSVWDECNYLWFLLYVEDWEPAEKAVPLEEGSVLHALIGAGYQAKIDNPQATNLDMWAAAKQAAIVYQAGTAHTDSLKILALILKLVERYFMEFSPREDGVWRFIATESHFEIPLVTPQRQIPYILQGYVDIEAERDGRLAVWDHKKIGNPSNFWTPVEVMMDAQLPTYAAAMRELGKPVTDIVINMFNSYEYKRDTPTVTQLFRREPTYRKDEELDSILFHTGLAVEETVLHQGVYRRSLNKDCKKCSMREPCLLGIKGVDPTTLLLTNFKKKLKKEENGSANQETGKAHYVGLL